jgi:hypothetical protein
MNRHERRAAAAQGGVPVVLSNVIDAVMMLINQRPQLATRGEILTFLETVKNEAKSAEQVVREAQIPLERWTPPQ